MRKESHAKECRQKDPMLKWQGILSWDLQKEFRYSDFSSMILTINF